jgi:hypothetical protein
MYLFNCTKQEKVHFIKNVLFHKTLINIGIFPYYIKSLKIFTYHGKEKSQARNS